MSNKYVDTVNFENMMEKQDLTDVEVNIVNAARRVFIEKGYVAASMGDIAAEAGIGRTTLNYYFRNKERLFESVLGQLIDFILPNIGTIIDDDKPFQEKLARIIDLYISTIKTYPGFPAFVIGELNRDPEHLYGVFLLYPQRIEFMRKFRRLIETGMEEGYLRKMPIIYVVSSLLGLALFPFLLEKPLTDIFLDGKKEAYDRFTEERKMFILDVMLKILDPQI